MQVALLSGYLFICSGVKLITVIALFFGCIKPLGFRSPRVRSPSALSSFPITASDRSNWFRFNLECSSGFAAQCRSPSCRYVSFFVFVSSLIRYRYTSSEVFVDRHSSFSAFLLFMFTMNTSSSSMPQNCIVPPIHLRPNGNVPVIPRCAVSLLASKTLE